MIKDILVLNIDLGEKQAEIHIKPNDTPLELAKKFCKIHMLNPSVESPLSQYISLELSKLEITPKYSKSPMIEIIPEESPPKRLVRGKSEQKKRDLECKTTENQPGLRLYQNALEKLKEKEQKIQKVIAEREASEVDGLTFRPTINTSNVSKTRVEDYSEKRRAFEERMKSRRLEKAKEELKDCTFHPTVNRSSSKTDQVKDRNIHLYYSAERKKNVEKPRVKKKERNNSVKKINICETIERLMKYQEKYNSNAEKARERLIEEEKFDKETKNERFKPIINSPVTDRKKRQNSSISNLYNFPQNSDRKVTERLKLIQYEEIYKIKNN